jgi:HK97 family phage major capsid protein
MKNRYQELITKQAALTTLVAKLAAENRGPDEQEKQQLETIRKEVKDIEAAFAEDGRKLALAALDKGNHAQKDQITFIKKGESLEAYTKQFVPEEQQELNLGKIIKGYLTGNWRGAELERKAAGEGSTGAGGVFIPELVSARVIDLARNVARVFQAGAQTIPMENATLRVPRLTQDATGGWYSENQDILSADGTFDGVTFTAHKLAVILAIDNELLEDAPSAAATLEMSIAKAAALALDLAALKGTGVAPQPAGLLNQADVYVHGSVGAVTDYSEIASQAAVVRGYNFEPNAFLWNAKTQSTFRKLQDTLHQPLRQPVTVPDTDFVTNQLANGEMYIGQWDQLAMGLRAGLQIETSREASYMDSTQSPAQLTSAFSRDQTIFRLRIRCDWQALHGHAFAISTGITVS